jgi:hypothetical protein
VYGLGRTCGFWEFCGAMVLADCKCRYNHENGKCCWLLLLVG